MNKPVDGELVKRTSDYQMSALFDVFTTSNSKEDKVNPPWCAQMYASKKRHIFEHCHWRLFDVKWRRCALWYRRREREQQIEGEEETSVGLTNYPKNPPIVITIDLCTITIMDYSAMNESWRYKLKSTWRVMLLNATMKIVSCVRTLQL